MNPQTIWTAINVFMAYMYDGNLSAGESGRALGNAISFEGFYTCAYGESGVVYPCSVISYGESEDYFGNFQYDSLFSHGYVEVGATSLSFRPSSTQIAIYSSRSGLAFDQFDIFGQPRNSRYTTDRAFFYLTYVPHLGNASSVPSNSSRDLNCIGGVNSLRDASLVTNNVDFLSSGYNQSDFVFLHVSPDETYPYDDFVEILESDIDAHPEWGLDPEDIPSFEDVAGIEAEPSESESDSCCSGCQVTVDAQGNVYIDGVQVDLTLNAQAGAFGAGAFGAGAIGQVNVNGDIDINGGISGDLNLNGGDISIDQSGSSITNNYYYYNSSGEPVEPSGETQPFTIDYDEILSESELESILNQGNYDIETIPQITYEGLYFPEKPIEPYLPIAVQSTPDLINAFAGIVSDTGLMPVYFPLGIFSVICYCLRGHR